MVRILETEVFASWMEGLRDRRAVYAINARLRRVQLGNFGDSHLVGGGISELRINYGPGYRLYFIREGAEVIVLLCGGDKDSQRRDIQTARVIANDWRNENGS